MGNGSGLVYQITPPALVSPAVVTLSGIAEFASAIALLRDPMSPSGPLNPRATAAPPGASGPGKCDFARRNCGCGLARCSPYVLSVRTHPHMHARRSFDLARVWTRVQSCILDMNATRPNMLGCMTYGSFSHLPIRASVLLFQCCLVTVEHSAGVQKVRDRWRTGQKGLLPRRG